MQKRETSAYGKSFGYPPPTPRGVSMHMKLKEAEPGTPQLEVKIEPGTGTAQLYNL